MRFPVSLAELNGVVDEQTPGGDPLERLAAAARIDGDITAVGTALLDHYVHVARSSGCSWAQIGAALGVTRQAAHLRFNDRITPRAPRWPSRFTETARRVIGRGADHARSWGLERFGTEHVLLAMTESAGDPATVLLWDLGLRAEVVQEHVAVAEACPPDSRARVTPSAGMKRALRSARGLADRLGHDDAGTVELLLGLAQGRSVTADILRAEGLAFARLREQAAQALGVESEQLTMVSR